MTQRSPIVDAVDPEAAYALLAETPSAALVDVRTRAEWTFVGLPDVSELGRPVWLIEWVEFPSMAPNRAFLPKLREAMGGRIPERLFFICRSGARSLSAARLVAEEMAAEGTPVHCTNVAEGFEGDLDSEGHRGSVAGWKARGLPWSQS
jgi:rhodanese-related sulfurtransferase